jgi:ribonuclease HII
LTLKELENEYGSASRVPPAILRRLRTDSRAGARRLYLRLKRRLDQREQERSRLAGMFRFERDLWRAGLERVAGVDEVGIGPMAGPVVAAAVVFRPDAWIDGVDDSKRLDEETRERLSVRIRETATGIGLGVVEPKEVDRLNVYHAGLRAMQLAVESLDASPDHVLVDSRTIPGIAEPQSSFDRGDTLSFSIASASIVAKVYRDRLMCGMDGRYPGYGFRAHKGYCTPEHQDAVRRLGPSPIHRRSFDFIREIRGEYSADFYELLKQADEVGSPEDLTRLEEGIKEHRYDLSSSERRKLHVVARRRKRVFR